MKIEMDKRYTYNGEPIRILCVDRPNTGYPVVAMQSDGVFLYFTEEGESMFRGDPALVEVRESKKNE
jgi:hypothetical protein